MPEFAPGSSHIATLPIAVAPAGLACEVELWLSPDGETKSASSGLVSFTSIGSQQQLSLPVTMPSEEQTYQVLIDIYCEGNLISAYQALEAVVVVSPLTPAPPDEKWPAGYATLYGYVRALDSQPIEGARVWEGWYGAYADANGYYILNKARDMTVLCPAGWGISCNHKDYSQAIKTVFLHKGDIKRLDFYLEA